MTDLVILKNKAATELFNVELGGEVHLIPVEALFWLFTATQACYFGS